MHGAALRFATYIVALGWGLALSPSSSQCSNQTTALLSGKLSLYIHSVSGDKVNVKDFGAKADGKHDDSEAIQRAIEHLGKKGGRIVMPASKQPYLISRPIVVKKSNVTIEGSGATLKLANRGSKPCELIVVSGTAEEPVRRVLIKGITLDGNCWQRDKREGIIGVRIRDAKQVQIYNVAIRNVFEGVRIGPNVSECSIVACRVTQWDRSAYVVSGGGRNQCVRRIEFNSCQASGSRNESNGGLPGERFAAWEIGGGASEIRVVDCLAAETDANGFVVHNPEPGEGISTARVEFLRCSVTKLGGVGWLVRADRWGRSKVSEVRIVNCNSEAPCVVCDRADKVLFENCKLSSLAIGFSSPDQLEPIGNAQAYKVALKNCDLSVLKVNVKDVPYSREKPEVRLANVNVWERFVYVGPEERIKASSSSLPVGPPATAPIGEWVSLFDGKTLKGWKITDFGGQGEVYVKDGAIYLEMGADLTGITWTGSVPRVDYEIELEAKRVDGTDFFCGLTFPVRDSCASLIVGGWGGSIVGISCLDGMDASENETTQFMEFEQNRWYKIKVRVTKSKIQAWIDDNKIIDTSIVGRNVDVRIEVELSKPLGIASWQTTAALRNIRIRRLPPSAEPKPQQ